MEKSTQELMQMLSLEKDISQYLKNNGAEFLEMPLHVYLAQLLEETGSAKNKVIRRSGLNQIYGYQIFAGTKHPNRDKLLALAFGFPRLSASCGWEWPGNCIPATVVTV